MPIASIQNDKEEEEEEVMQLRCGKITRSRNVLDRPQYA